MGDTVTVLTGTREAFGLVSEVRWEKGTDNGCGGEDMPTIRYALDGFSVEDIRGPGMGNTVGLPGRHSAYRAEVSPSIAEGLMPYVHAEEARILDQIAETGPYRNRIATQLDSRRGIPEVVALEGPGPVRFAAMLILQDQGSDYEPPTRLLYLLDGDGYPIGRAEIPYDVEYVVDIDGDGVHELIGDETIIRILSPTEIEVPVLHPDFDPTIC